jgi:hypothetical protein
MKKIIFLFLLALWMKQSCSQNWQLVTSNKVQWFSGQNNNLKVIYADSVTAINGDSIFYFPFTMGTRVKIPFTMPVISLKSPSWMGSKMILKPDGRQLFFNAENDTITILPGKGLNEEWTMVNFPGGNIKKAKIIMVGKDTIAGMPDSIKKIQLPDHSEFMISKNNGFFSVLPFFSILDSPLKYQYEMHTEKYAWKKYDRTSAGKRLTNGEVFGFNKGSVYQVQNHNGGAMVKTRIIDKIDFGDSVKYIGELTYESLKPIYSLDSTVQKEWWIKNSNSLFTQKYPEQYDTIPDYREYFYALNNCGLVTISTEHVPLIRISDTLYYNTFEPDYWHTVKYGEHLGLIKNTTIKNLADPVKGDDYELTFSQNENCKIGTWAYGISNTQIGGILSIYPNPVINKFTVRCNNIQQIKIFNLLGEEIHLKTLKKNEKEKELDAREIAPGVYYLKIDEYQSTRFLKIAE